MSKNVKHAADRPRVDPLGDLKIAEARGKFIKSLKVCRIFGANQKGDIRDYCQDQIQYRCC